MIYLTQEEIAIRYNVTQEQIDACTRVLDGATGEVFFQAKSSHYAENNTVYTIRYHREFRRLSCDCPFGKDGGLCQHKRAATAVQYEHKQAENIAARKEAEASRLSSYRVLEQAREAAQAALAGLKAGKEVRQAQPFSLLK